MSSSFWSMHICATGPGGPPGSDVVISQSPDLGFGRSAESAATGSAAAIAAMTSPRMLDHHHVDELVHRHRRETLRIQRNPEDRLLLLHGEAVGEVGLELLDEHGHAFRTTAAMADRVFDD